MKIKNITIQGVGGIKDLTLSFSDGVNILCGPNGIGKTTILECIAHSFTRGFPTSILKKRVMSENGSIRTEVEDNGVSESCSLNIESSVPQDSSHINGLHGAEKILPFKIERIFGYSPLKTISKDEDKDWLTAVRAIESGINLSTVKNWFANRYLFSHIENNLRQEQLHNLRMAIDSFGLLDSNFSFSRLKADTYDIMLNTPQGEIYYEYLSAGYKSILYIIWGIIQEIEYRFKDPYVNADDFDGVVLIDEIDEHLHPEWQEKILSVLKDIFPRMQFIVTTHSPHIIQTAKRNEVHALAFDDDNNVVCREDISSTEDGFLGWTLEEILTDVMGVSTLRSRVYNDLREKYKNALDNGQKDDAVEAYNKIKPMLHADSVEAKLMDIQMTKLS